MEPSLRSAHAVEWLRKRFMHPNPEFYKCFNSGNTKQQDSELGRCLAKVDTGSSGSLSITEIHSMLKSIGIGISQQECFEIFQSWHATNSDHGGIIPKTDLNKSGLNFEQFKAFIMSEEGTKKLQEVCIKTSITSLPIHPNVHLKAPNFSSHSVHRSKSKSALGDISKNLEQDRTSAQLGGQVELCGRMKSHNPPTTLSGSQPHPNPSSAPLQPPCPSNPFKSHPLRQSQRLKILFHQAKQRVKSSHTSLRTNLGTLKKLRLLSGHRREQGIGEFKQWKVKEDKKYERKRKRDRQRVQTMIEQAKVVGRRMVEKGCSRGGSGSVMGERPGSVRTVKVRSRCKASFALKKTERLLRQKSAQGGKKKAVSQTRRSNSIKENTHMPSIKVDNSHINPSMMDKLEESSKPRGLRTSKNILVNKTIEDFWTKNITKFDTNKPMNQPDGNSKSRGNFTGYSKLLSNILESLLHKQERAVENKENMHPNSSLMNRKNQKNLVKMASNSIQYKQNLHGRPENIQGLRPYIPVNPAQPKILKVIPNATKKN
ncbi:unnamed protein product [Moneuplotes crassus]|uniref:EF-hand domain-containing protein n=1 Tax=Euplotes crassus TaxID=5936 RepID=A0AAD2D7W4_EUPCR|nr:unnamed protein product [Moneuplotes crassus]